MIPIQKSYQSSKLMVGSFFAIYRNYPIILLKLRKFYGMLIPILIHVHLGYTKRMPI